MFMNFYIFIIILFYLFRIVNDHSRLMDCLKSIYAPLSAALFNIMLNMFVIMSGSYSLKKCILHSVTLLVCL